MPSLLETVITQSYESLAAGEDTAVRRMAVAHSRTVTVLDGQLREIEAIIARDEARGMDSGTYLLQRQRLASFIVQAEAEFQQYGSQVGLQLSESQRKAVATARQFVPASIEAINGPAPLSFGFVELPKGAITELVSALGDGSPLRTLSESFAGDASRIFNRILLEGVASGDSMVNTVKKMRAAMPDIGRARAETIVRTETLRAYREASRKTMLANDKVVKGWRWFAARDTRCCPVCWAMHATEFKLTASMATHPNCRCTQLPITRSWAELGFKTPKEPKPPKDVITPGPKQFAKLSDEDKRLILGRGGFLAYKKGLVKLPDFVQETYSPLWGYGRSTKSLRGMVGDDVARELYRGRIPTSVIPGKLDLPEAEDLVTVQYKQIKSQRSANLTEAQIRARQLGAPIVPTTDVEAVDMYIASLLETDAVFAGDATLQKRVRTNWNKKLKGNVTGIPDDEFHAIQDAVNWNYENPEYVNVTKKFGQDRVIYTKPFDTSASGATGERIQGVTFAYKPTGKYGGVRYEEAGTLIPGQSSTGGGTSGFLRHEYGHNVHQKLEQTNPTQYNSLVSHFPEDKQQLQSEMSRYAGEHTYEAFSETFTVVTDPNYNSGNWAGWVHDFKLDLDSSTP